MTAPTEKSNFRTDIEGLRGVAVLLVTLFHLEITGLGGGYLGVDIFFVISGFLITSHIRRALEANAFSFRNFYLRRIRRIAPPFLLVTTLTLAVAFLVMLPRDFQQLGSYALSSIWYLSNFHFAAATGYFSTPASTNPLLHTWSLSVEEQFYLVIPAAMVVFHKGVGLKWLHSTVFIVSLLVAIIFRHSDAAFFISFPRFWEFSVGAFAAYVSSNGRMRNWGGIIGAALIIYAVFCLKAGDSLNVFGALLVTLGSGLLITFPLPGKGSLVLNNAVIRYFGRVSYSLYLWHWPVIGLLTYLSVIPLSGSQIALAFCLSLALAHVTWLLVESRNQKRGGRELPAWLIFAGSTTVLSLACSIVSTGLVTKHASPEVERLASFSSDVGPFRHCLDEAAGACGIGATGKPSFILWGDSHAAAIAAEVDAIAKAKGKTGTLLVTHSCTPVIGIPGWWSQTRARCLEQNTGILKLAADPGIKTVIMHAFWDRGMVGIADDAYGVGAYTDQKAKEAFAENLAHTITTFQKMGKKVVIVSNVVTATSDVPRGLAIMEQSGLNVQLGRRKSDVLAEFKTEQVLLKVAEELSETVVKPSDDLCKASYCTVYDGHAAYFFDWAHLTPEGAAAIKGLAAIKPLL